MYRKTGIRNRDNAAGIGDNSSGIGDNSSEIGDGGRDSMLNFVLNVDWSNSVPGRKIPEGGVQWHSHGDIANTEEYSGCY